MAMLAAAAIAAGILPQRNGRRRAVTKQWYGCTSTEDFCLCAVSYDYYFSNSYAELISGLD